MRKNALTLKVFAAIIITDVVESMAGLVMKYALNSAGIIHVNLSNFSDMFWRGFSSYLIWVGVLLYILNFFIWIAILTRIQLSVAFPIGSTCYIYVPILSVVFLHEIVTPLRWLGIVLIILGIHFVSKSTQKQKEGFSL